MFKRHLLITGLPGTGKTTLLIRLARRLADKHPAGFYTEEIREGGERLGFRLLGLDGKEGILSHTGIKGRPRVGRYGVNLKGFEAFLAELDLEGTTSPLVFIDEIGKMECLSPRFVTLVRNLLDSGKTIVATVALKGEGFMDEVKERHDCEIIELTIANRDKLLEHLVGWVMQRLRA